MGKSVKGDMVERNGADVATSDDDLFPVFGGVHRMP